MNRAAARFVPFSLALALAACAAPKPDPQRFGIYSARLDGSDQHQIPLPRGFLHRHPNFIPGAGEGGDARILFCARRDPNIR